jgi:hypothetical protein
MTRWMIVAGLAVLNAALGAGVYSHLMERDARAQAVAPRPDVAAVAGNSGGQIVVYLLDMNTGKLIAQRVDAANGRLETIGPRDVAQDIARLRP